MLLQIGVEGAFAGFAVLLGTMLLMIYLGMRISRRRKRTARATDKRVQRIQEVLEGMLTVKTYNWEEAFATVIGGLRRVEVSSILATQRIKAINLTMYVWLSRER